MSESKQQQPGPLPSAKKQALARACRLEWLTLALRVSVVAALYAALGSTHALTAIWLKSLWTLLPPIAFLTACRIEQRPPTPRFPYGFCRAGGIAFLGSALALACMGLYLIYSSLQGLMQARTPSLESFAEAESLLTWAGWPMIAALLYSIAVPLIAGRARQSLAVALHDKGLYADATMGRASWLAGGAVIIGLLGIGAGLWWTDFVAALVVGFDITWHGYRHLKTAVCDLIDEVPRRLGTHTIDPLGATIRDHLENLDWVGRARVRLREEGRMLIGVAFVCPHHETEPMRRFEAARQEILRLDWRLLDFELIPVDAARDEHMRREIG